MIERWGGLSLNLFKILAIRVSTKWYKDHLKTNGSGEDIEIVLLTDDRGNREKATATGIKSSDGKVNIIRYKLCFLNISF